MSFLWAASRNLIPASPYAISSKKEIVSWSKKLHSISILPNDPHKDRTTYESTGDLSVVAETMVRLRTALENKLDYKKKEKEENKNRWSKLLSHQRNMILNVATIDGKVQAAVPCKNLLEVMSQPTLAEARVKVNSIMSRRGAQVNLPLVLVKSLISGDWNNDNNDNSSKLSMFFLGAND